MHTNKKRSENDQYNETSNHIQMKGGGGGGAGTPGDAGGPPRRRRTLSFVFWWWFLKLLFFFPFRGLSFMYKLYKKCIKLPCKEIIWKFIQTTFRIGSSKVGLRQQKNHDFSDWVIQGGPPAAKSQVFLIFRSIPNAFWHADLRELVESFRNHQ